ncbi:MAG: zf-HC2 domain-containing protein [Terriglobales bacterium]
MKDTPKSEAAKTGLPKAGLPGAAASRLRDGGKAASAHPEANLLAAFSEQALTAPERDEVLTHLAQCGDCREIVSLAMSPASAAVGIEPQPVVIRGWFGMRPEFMRWAIVGASASVVVAAVLVASPEFVSSRKTTSTFDVAQKQAESAAVDNTVTATRPAEPATAATAKPAKPAEEKDTRAAEKKQSADASYFKVDGADIAPVGGRSDAPTLMAKETAPAPVMPPPMASTAETSTPNAAGRGMGAGQAGGIGNVSQSQAAEVTTARVAPQKLAMKPSANQAATLGNEARLADADSRMANDGAADKKAKNELARERQTDAAKDETTVAGSPSLGKRELSADAVEVEGAFAVQGAVNARNMKSLRYMEPRTWRVLLGKLQSSLDGGQTWLSPVLPAGVQPLTVDAGQPFAVWVGGRARVLLRSLDEGATWTRITGGWSGDVVYIKFADAKHGVLRTSRPGISEEWITEDGGVNWKKR